MCILICITESIFFLMIRRPPRSTRTDTSFPTRRSSDLLIIRADFLEQPEYPLRAAVVQMVDDQAHGLSFGSGPIGAVAVDQRRELADQLGDRKSTRLNSSH